MSMIHANSLLSLFNNHPKSLKVSNLKPNNAGNVTCSTSANLQRSLTLVSMISTIEMALYVVRCNYYHNYDETCLTSVSLSTWRGSVNHTSHKREWECDSPLGWGRCIGCQATRWWATLTGSRFSPYEGDGYPATSVAPVMIKRWIVVDLFLVHLLTTSLSKRTFV